MTKSNNRIWTIRDADDVVHTLPKFWALRSWQATCGVEPPHRQPSLEVPTCIACIGITQRKVE